MNQKKLTKSKNFHELHTQSTTFVLPNAWDAISAKTFEQSGFQAIGTTSAGIAMSLGYADGQNMPFEKLIDTISTISNAVDIPVSADIEAGYGFTIEEIVNNVKQVIDAGAIGINIEDGTGNVEEPLHDLTIQTENIEAIRDLSDSLSMSLFINARTDLYWANVGAPEKRFEEALKRAKAYVEAGANCIFIPGLTDLETIKKFRKEISVPINLLAHSELPSLSDLSAIGIERVSCGSGPFRATVTHLKSISEEIFNTQSFDKMTKNVLSYADVAAMIK